MEVTEIKCNQCKDKSFDIGSVFVCHNCFSGNVQIVRKLTVQGLQFQQNTKMNDLDFRKYRTKIQYTEFNLQTYLDAYRAAYAHIAPTVK